MLDVLIRTVCKILQNIVHFYSYKITHVQQLLPAVTWKHMNLLHYDFLPQWKWTMKGHGTFCGLLKVISICKILLICKIAGYEWPRIHSSYNHHFFSLKRSLCGIASVFIINPFFFEEIACIGPVTCTITGNSMKHFCITMSFQHFSCISV